MLEPLRSFVCGGRAEVQCCSAAPDPPPASLDANRVCETTKPPLRRSLRAPIHHEPPPIISIKGRSCWRRCVGRFGHGHLAMLTNMVPWRAAMRHRQCQKETHVCLAPWAGLFLINRWLQPPWLPELLGVGSGEELNHTQPLYAMHFRSGST